MVRCIDAVSQRASVRGKRENAREETQRERRDRSTSMARQAAVEKRKKAKTQSTADILFSLSHALKGTARRLTCAAWCRRRGTCSRGASGGRNDYSRKRRGSFFFFFETMSRARKKNFSLPLQNSKKSISLSSSFLLYFSHSFSLSVSDHVGVTSLVSSARASSRCREKETAVESLSSL